MKENEKKFPNLGVIESILILIILLSILGYLIIGQHMTPHVPILISFMLLMFYGWARGFSWDIIFEGILEGIKPGIIPIIIFMLIGVLVASWLLSGTIPTIMFYGFKILSGKFFLGAVFIVCSLVAITCGSSFTTVSTMGIAFLGIGTALGINSALIAGAVVSGSFFGANVSPLSGTVNLAAAVAEVDLYEHIRTVLKTDGVAFIISLLAYGYLGKNAGHASMHEISVMNSALVKGFWISPVTLLPALLLLVLAWRKFPAIPSMMLGSAFAIGLEFWHDRSSITLNSIANVIMKGYIAHTGNSHIDELLSRGGINSMMGSVALILLALALGGLLIKFNIIGILIHSAKEYIQTPGKVILLTSISCMLVNLLVGEQYFSLILPGQSFISTFKRLKINRLYLSRTLNDAGGSFNSIIPWGVSGTFIAGALQINPLHYIPYAFFPILVPIINIFAGYMLNFKRNKLKE